MGGETVHAREGGEKILREEKRARYVRWSLTMLMSWKPGMARTSWKKLDGSVHCMCRLPPMIEVTAPYPLEDYVRGDCRVSLLLRHSCAFLQSFRNETAKVWVPSADEDFACFVEERL